MKITILSKNNGVEFTKREEKEIKSFFYDEDVLWLDIGKKRYGLNLDTIKKERKEMLKELNEELKN